MALLDNHDIFRDGDTNFHKADPERGLPATIPTAPFLNSLQEEVCTAIEGAGISLNAGVQLAKALERYKYGFWVKNPNWAPPLDSNEEVIPTQRETYPKWLDEPPFLPAPIEETKKEFLF